ncbi:MAG TPA: protein translocase subunit SecD [Candidatus Krumholzibacteria bacterium]|nr:protein translocase subunit SecD [Candidatus Krumholzibacteria bacterium]
MKTRWKLVVIAVVLGYSIWALLPSIRFYSMSDEQRAKLTNAERIKYIDSAIKLGLDLQGGAHLVMEVDDSNMNENAKKDAVDRAIKIFRNRIDQFGVAEPVIQKQGTKRIIIELPGLEDLERAERILGQTAKLEFRLVRQSDELSRTLNLLDKTLKGVTVKGTQVDSTGTGAAEAGTKPGETQTASTTPNKGTAAVDSLLPTLQTDTETNVPMPEASPDKPFTSHLLSYVEGGVVVDEREVPIVNALLNTEQAQRAIPSNSTFLWADRANPMEDNTMARVLYMVEKVPTLDGSSLVNAQTRNDPEDPSRLNVAFTLNRQGAIKFARFTGENIGRRIAIVLDDKVRSAPAVQSKIPNGEGRITGMKSDEEANDLSIVLRAGALPAKITTVELRSIGPTLGKDSIDAGRRATLVGFILVVVFMIIYYRLSGILASIALVFNMIIILAVMATLRATLTMPGIAGLVLTIGMSVDANVLIFERIREELAKGKTVRAAIQAGFDKAFATILDSHVTTLITAFVLWQFGTGPIKGFATTLSVGLIANMFTALTCTRVVYDIITSRRHVERLSI